MTVPPVYVPDRDEALVWYAVARANVGRLQASDLDDARQEARMALVRAAKAWRGDRASWGTYAMVVMRRALLRWNRKRLLRGVGDFPHDDTDPPEMVVLDDENGTRGREPDPLEGLVGKEAAVKIRRAIRVLPVRRQPIYWDWLAGRRVTDTAARQRITPTRVQQLRKSYVPALQHRLAGLL
jgi:RNA polymerase sigma factor (sigma-70 family)